MYSLPLGTDQGQCEWLDPVTRIGQGNRAGPQIWAVVSTPLFKILHQEGFVTMVIYALSLQHPDNGGLSICR